MSKYLVLFGKPRYLGIMEIFDLPVQRGEWILIETTRGVEIGLVGGELSGEQEERYRSSCLEESDEGQPKGGEPTLQNVVFKSRASSDDLNVRSQALDEEQRVLISAREILKGHNLPMKLVDVEYLLDRKKLFFYFTSEQRVDFRAYVRDLAREFKTRIELRQIGVRDEAKSVKGISPCGRECCCSYWLHRFTPICIRMVKEQNLALNPTKISGICGRLMCCMSFEHEMYTQLWKNLPNPGSKVKGPMGNFLLLGIDLKAAGVRVRCPDGKEILVSVADFEEFRSTVLRGDEWRQDETMKPQRSSRSHPPVKPRAPQRSESPSHHEEQIRETKSPDVAEKDAPPEPVRQKRPHVPGDQGKKGQERKGPAGDSPARPQTVRSESSVPDGEKNGDPKRPPRKRKRRKRRVSQDPSGTGKNTGTESPSGEKQVKPESPGTLPKT